MANRGAWERGHPLADCEERHGSRALLNVIEEPAVAILLLLSLGASLSTLPAAAQDAPPATQPPEITFHSSSNLVLVPVIALNPKTGLPDKTLQRDDFQIFDNDRPVAIATFDSGGQLRARPVALWFLLQCSMQKYDREGSGFFRGRMNLFTPALKNLDKHDTVAVAHWCDNGAAQVDLRPTTNVDAAVTTAEQVLAPTVNVDNHDRPGELALQKSLQLIVDTTRSLTPEPAPVVVFLYGDWSGMDRAEADHFIGELLETSAIVYGLKDSRSGAMPIPLRLLGSAFQEQMEVAKYIATQTGGEYASVAPETYSTSLEEILRQLHFRYELGFKPEALDGKRHKLEVKLAAGLKKQRHGVRLRYRPAYVPARQETR